MPPPLRGHRHRWRHRSSKKKTSAASWRYAYVVSCCQLRAAQLLRAREAIRGPGRLGSAVRRITHTAALPCFSLLSLAPLVPMQLGPRFRKPRAQAGGCDMMRYITYLYQERTRVSSCSRVRRPARTVHVANLRRAVSHRCTGRNAPDFRGKGRPQPVCSSRYGE